MHIINIKNTILTFCVYVDIVIRAASTIRRAGLVALGTLREKSWDFADAKTEGLLKIDYGDLSWIDVLFNS